eukprot:1161832-Pelagomonas_calceolata.AAC.11
MQAEPYRKTNGYAEKRVVPGVLVQAALSALLGLPNIFPSHPLAGIAFFQASRKGIPASTCVQTNLHGALHSRAHPDDT